ncbi:protein tilB homolog [Strongylocentrotus purpuratus]|uniref:Dynein axonemal assembly factor 11-like CS domain-containing protein n=1 Tax=Strongylocentrotus purpuratus TaxID=7668 RepID=A0A7M7HDU1_STRPU|nr:protein tilB homolog [Strongylocentrotus purpuratus]XP_011666757.2 protein tilB homolog [Strongylocentrotus purpuratus]XP_791802.3 protein tilB homolog [Strongylocentrotus purpuratus]
MVRITEDMVRKRSEHNEMEISTLEEISLHQQDIERIEFLDKWCRHLKILYLQSNLIPKIENVGRLKKLEYLNLALNNVERIENLSGCESLTKLDLTVNFVGELTSIECLRDSYSLREIFLTGNPCTEYEGYKEFVIGTLPQLKRLDGKEIEKSERISALQEVDAIRPKILEQQKAYQLRREKEKSEAENHKKEKEEKKERKKGFDKTWYTDINEDDTLREKPKSKDEEEDEEEEFWNEKVGFTPESRVALSEHVQEKKRQEEEERSKKQGPNPPKRVVRLTTDDGNPLNVNEAKIDFSLTDNEEENTFDLDVSCFKHLDTSLIDVDVQPTHVKVVLKGKVLQLTLTEEVMPDASEAKRSLTTGHLLVKMPKVKEYIRPKKSSSKPKPSTTSNKDTTKTSSVEQKLETLEVDPSSGKHVDLMVTNSNGRPTKGPVQARCQTVEERKNSEDFIDNPDVPPLI